MQDHDAGRSSGVYVPMFGMVVVDFFSKIGTKRTESELDKWFEQLREHGRRLGVEGRTTHDV